MGGVGDLVTGYKHVLLSNLRTGSILSLAGEVVWPTGNAARGMGKGVTVFESFASYGQVLPKGSFLQFQGGVEAADAHRRCQPGRVLARRWWARASRRIRDSDGCGRPWSSCWRTANWRREQRVNWDVVPQFQVTLNRRQHIRANIGVRIPVNDYGPRSTQILFYLLWDTFDGGLLDGWK